MGLGLSVLAGPILFMLIQTGLERGLRAGVALGAGAWSSDLLYVLLVYNFLSYIKALTDGPDFYLYLGLIGGILVLIIGIATLFSKSPEMKDPDHPSGQDLPARYSQLWLKGFLVNTLNPFAFFFWLSAASIGSVQGGGTGVYNAWIYLAGVFSMIIATDVLKVAGAKKIRYLLSKEKMDKVRLFIAVLLIISGVVLLVRTWMHFYK